MPIYAYRCAACGHAKDVLQKLSDPLLHICPACSAEAFTKQVTAAGFQLKGSGWYATDFKSSGAAPAKPDPQGDKPDSAKPDDAKSEAGKAESAKSEGGKQEGGKPEGGKSEGSKPESAAAPSTPAPAAPSAPAA